MSSLNLKLENTEEELQLVLLGEQIFAQNTKQQKIHPGISVT